MVTTLQLTTHLLTWLPFSLFLFVVTIFKICPPSNFQVYNTMFSTTVTMLYIRYQESQFILSLKICALIPTSPCLPDPCAPGNYFLLSLSTSLAFDSTYKWNDTIFVFLWLIPFHLAQSPQGPSELLQTAGFPPSYWQCPIYSSAAHSLSCYPRLPKHVKTCHFQ